VVGHESLSSYRSDNFATVQDGWNDIQGSENGDKCAGQLWPRSMNITRSSPVQPLWSNRHSMSPVKLRAFCTDQPACHAGGRNHAPTVDICMTTGICPPGVAAGQRCRVNMA